MIKEIAATININIILKNHNIWNKSIKALN